MRRYEKERTSERLDLNVYSTTDRVDYRPVGVVRYVH